MSRAFRLTLTGMLLVAGACGFDGVGTYVDPVTPPPMTTAAPTPTVPAPEPAAFCDPRDPSLVACLRFEGAARDESSHAQAVQVTGAPGFVPGMNGSSVSLTATTTIHVPHGPAWSFGALTMEMWFRPRALPAGGGRAGLMDKNGAFGLFVQSNGDVTCTIGASLRAQAAAVPDRWTHVACTNGSGRAALYIDGREIASAPAGALNTGSELTAIGGDSPSGAPFVGEIDDVRVFSRARTAEEVAAAAK